MLPSALLSAIGSASVVGFSGSRSVVPPALAAVCAAVPAEAAVAVGCAAGVDATVRAAFPSATVFSVASFGVVGRGAFAVRSVAFVRSLAGGGLLLSFPSGACPPGLLPSASSSRAFCGAGSGSWAAIAFAIGLGVSCFVLLPSGVAAPVGWGLVPVGGGWWSFVPASQLSLF